MSIIVFVEDWNNQFKKASFEAVSYAKSWAELAGTTVTAVTSSGAADTAALAHSKPFRTRSRGQNWRGLPSLQLRVAVPQIRLL